MKNIIQALKVISLALILSFGISYVYAWTAPTVTPPGGNVSAPINTSVIAQYKEGAIGIGGLIRGYANAVFDGNVGIGTTAPGAKLEVVGDVISKGTLWTSRISPTNNNWYSVAYGNGLFVAVAGSGTSNRVMTSPDGITWTSRMSAADNSWRYVTYGNGLFVAVACGVNTTACNATAGNRVMTSPDGITWTSRTSAANNSWTGVTYGNGLFVAVANSGTSNRVMTSPDGITWTTRTSAADNWWTGVTYGNGLFVAVANSGTSNRVMTSSDGITWTTRTSAADNQWLGVTYGNGLFVAVANTGTGNRVMTSPDGITWTARTSAADNYWIGVTYGNGLFVAVAWTGIGNRVMTSPDGITWTSRTSAADNSWIGVTYGNGLFVAVSNSGIGNRVMTSGKQDDQVVSHNNTYQGGMNIYGNVGIGTKSPTQPLDVVGNIKGTGVCIGTDCKTAWPVAGVNPPAGSSFLDTSATAQTKSGDLTVNKITSTTSCIGTDCKTSWPVAGVNPPTGSSFLDTSATAQTKSGDLTVNKITSTTSCIGTDCKTAWPTGGSTPPVGSTFLDTSATAQTKDGTLTVGGFKIPGGTTGKVLISDAVGNASWGTNPVSTIGGGMLPRESFYNNAAFNGTGANVFTAPAGVTEVLVEVFGAGGGGGTGYIGGSNGATGGISSFGPIASPHISATSGSGGTVVVEVWCDGTCATNGTTGASGSGSGGYVNSRLYSLDQFGSGGLGNLMLARGGTGGRGGYSKGIIPVTPGTTYTVTVGAGGAGGCYYGYYCGSAGSDGFVRVSYLGDVTLTPIQKCANAGGMALDANGNCTYTYSNLQGTFGWSRELRNGDGQYVCANVGGKPTWTYLSNTTSTHGTSCGNLYGLVYWSGTSYINWGEFGGICGGNVTVESTVTCKVPI